MPTENIKLSHGKQTPPYLLNITSFSETHESKNFSVSYRHLAYCMLDSQMNDIADSMGTDTQRITTVTLMHVLWVNKKVPVT